jgi:hypothetical protein
MTFAPSIRPCRSVAQAVWALAMGFSAAGSLLFLAWTHPALPLRVGAVLLPVACGAVWISYLIRDLRLLDELQLRIHLEAAAISCVGIFTGALVYPVVQRAGFVGPLQPRYVLLAVLALAGTGYFMASRRYR